MATIAEALANSRGAYVPPVPPKVDPLAQALASGGAVTDPSRLAAASQRNQVAANAMANYAPYDEPQTLTQGPPTAQEDILQTLPSTISKIPYYVGGAVADALGYGMQTGRVIDSYLGNPTKTEEEIAAANPMRDLTSSALQGDYEQATGTDYYEPQTGPGVAADVGMTLAMPGPGGKVKAAGKVGEIVGVVEDIKNLARLNAPAGIGHNKGPPMVDLGAYKTTTPGKILNESNKGGYSVHVPTGKLPESGLFSGIYANADPRNTVVSGRKATRRDVLEAFKKNRKVMQQKNKYFGGWKDDQGTMYLEPSQRFEEDKVREATKFAERTQQKKIFRRSDFAELPVGDWEEFVKSDEFVDKLVRMGREGRTATEAAAGPGVEWWDLPVLDEVYGPYAETARKFLATTSANATPAENVRKMTEYMRRWLKGEEIVQPDFRVPETATHFTPGMQMGLEESLAPNLGRSARGEELSGPSVGGKDRVMNRPSADPLDPRDYVPDRRWARIAEDPSRGIFTSGSEGVIRDEEQVTKIGQAIAKAAEREGRSVRNLSADVWFALNPTETAQPYNKLIEDAIVQKAPTLGMTVKQFKEEMGKGNVELLSILLATPALAGIARQILPSGSLTAADGGGA